jgi:hypothetical protein
MSKSLPCKFFQKGTCAYSEEECVFSHSQTQKKKICPFFLKGTCRYGDSCALKHSKKGSGVKANAPSIPKPKAQVLASTSAASSSRDPTIPIPQNTTFANLIKKTELIALDDMDQDLDILDLLPSSLDELSTPESGTNTQTFDAIDQDILKPWLIASEHLTGSKESLDWSKKKNSEPDVDEQSLCPFYYQGQCRYALLLTC